MFSSLRLQPFALLVGFSVVTAVPAPCQEAVESPGVVLGRVLDDESGKPIETVEIRLVGEAESLVQVTDGEGVFLFPRVRPGNYEVVLKHLAYGTHTDSVEVGEGELVSYEARLMMEPIDASHRTSLSSLRGVT